MSVHLWFDLAAAASAAAVTVACCCWRLREAAARIDRAGPGYGLALVAGATAGGYAAGTANLWLSGEPVVGRSIVGALAGGIAAVEAYKWSRGLAGSTGLVFVPGFSTSVAVGRFGCFHSGLADHTHGVPTTLPWGSDFGDGIPRHPVQLYEAAAMGLFLVVALVLIGRRDAWFLRNGFSLMVLWYAVQRFAWESLKPYAAVIGPLTIFQVICVGLACYAAAMLWRSRGAVLSPAPPG